MIATRVPGLKGFVGRTRKANGVTVVVGEDTNLVMEYASRVRTKGDSKIEALCSNQRGEELHHCPTDGVAQRALDGYSNRLVDDTSQFISTPRCVYIFLGQLRRAYDSDAAASQCKVSYRLSGESQDGGSKVTNGSVVGDTPRQRRLVELSDQVVAI